MTHLTTQYVQSLAEKSLRLDGRHLNTYRDITIETGVSSKSAEGSAIATIGATRVVAGVKLEVATPYPDRPDEGTIMVNAELIPLSSPDFESGPPSIDSIELSRVVDRGIRESKCLDFKKLCIKPREKMWIVIIDIYPLNNDGNLFDAAFLAAMAALRDTKFPGYDEEKGMVDYKEKTKKGLPLAKLPTSCTVWKVNGKFLVDPLVEEELAATARLTVAMSDEKTVCALQKGGDGPINLDEINRALSLVVEKSRDLRGHFA